MSEPQGPLIPPEPGHKPGFQVDALMKVLRGAGKTALDTVATRGGPIEAVLQRLFPDYESQGVGPYSAETPEEWAQVAQGFAGAGPTRLERAILSGEVTNKGLSKFVVRQLRGGRTVGESHLGLNAAPWAEELRRTAYDNPALQNFPKEQVDRIIRFPEGKKAASSPLSSLKRGLRKNLRTPKEDTTPVTYKGERMPMEELRARTDRAVVKNAAGRPEHHVSVIDDPTRGQLGAGYTEITPEAPITVNVATSGGPADRAWRADVLGKPNPAGVQSLIPDVTDWFKRRATLAHELGERQVIHGERPLMPFSSHAGPSARMNEWEIAGARSPVALEATLRGLEQSSQTGYLPQAEGELVRLWRQQGGTANRPLPNDLGIARRLADRLRQKKNADPLFAIRGLDASDARIRSDAIEDAVGRTLGEFLRGMKGKP